MVATVAFAGSGIAVAHSASLARQPTPAERAAIIRALPPDVQRIPIGCVWLAVTVSNNGRYARVVPQDLNAGSRTCAKYSGNGYWIMKKLARWKTVFLGSVDPPCSLHIPRDLQPCSKHS
ncbi:MAG TPA: hypothetical protein VKR79_09535 [Gaiellaceae bacterium]|nr:hypothetical protein [Gaiellaceae bacterium]